jgi:hypothetical protein
MSFGPLWCKWAVHGGVDVDDVVCVNSQYHSKTQKNRKHTRARDAGVSRAPVADVHFSCSPPRCRRTPFFVLAFGCGGGHSWWWSGGGGVSFVCDGGGKVTVMCDKKYRK